MTSLSQTRIFVCPAGLDKREDDCDFGNRLGIRSRPAMVSITFTPVTLIITAQPQGDRAVYLFKP